MTPDASRTRSRSSRARACAHSSLLAFVLSLLVACGGSGNSTAAPGEPGGGNPPGGGLPAATSASVEIVDLRAEAGSLPGQVVLRFTAPAASSQGTVTAYEVRSQVAHINAVNAASAALLPVTHTPGAPGSAEAMTLSGLEPGSTRQFVVRAMRGGAAGSFSHGAAARAKAAPAPSAPAGATLLSAATTITSSGYYRLTQNVSASGTAFTISARNVTLDLGGHTVTYGTGGGTTIGIRSQFLYNSGQMVVTNGTLRQSPSSTAANSTAIDFTGGHDIRIHHLTIDTYGPGSNGIWISQTPTGTVRVDHCTVRCLATTVPNRHYPGVSGIVVEDIVRSCEVDHNLISASPQWGIKVAGDTTSSPYTSRIHHNRVVGTRARVSNGYMIGVHKPNTDVFENFLSGESRGIHVDGVDNKGHGAVLHDNYIRAQDQPNAEFSPHWCHGIKLENPTSATVFHNHVTVVADATHDEARAIDIDVEGGGTFLIQGNRISGISSVGTKKGKAVQWSGGSLTASNQFLARFNVFRATDEFVYRFWHAEHGGAFQSNEWIRDLSQGPGHSAVFEYWDNQDGVAAPGHRFIDAISDEDTTRVTQWANPGPYVSTREHTVRVIARDAGGGVVAGASVIVRDKSSAVVFSGTTDAQGISQGLVTTQRIRPGPIVDARAPFSLSVTHASGSFSGPLTLTTGAVTMHVDLGAGTASPDTLIPSTPAGVAAYPLSASRALVRHAAATDAGGIARYRIFLGGVLERLTDQTTCVLSGLTPGASYQVTVQAVDISGNASAVSGTVTLTQPVEDRGP